VNCAYSIEELLDKYKVDIFNAGHMHAYMRHFPIAPNEEYEVQEHGQYINPQHPVYIISGAAGVSNGSHHEGDGHDHDENEPYIPVGEAPPPTVIATLEKSYSQVKVFNHTHLHYLQIAAENGAVVDNFWIIKDPHRGPWSKTDRFGMLEMHAKQCDQ